MFRPHRFMLAAVALACAAGWAPALHAQAPAGAAPAAAPSQGSYTAAQLETLVGPIALYADDLIAIVLPASTYPLQIVQVERWLEKRKTNKDLKVDDNWDDSVKSLANYPDVIKKMSADLDWTEALGTAVATSNNQVMEAIQAFRRKAQSAGHLKSDDKQVVKVEQQIIQIEPADPQVVYVPTYDPAQVVVYGGSPYYYGWSSAYPAYWYPYAPGAALAAGIVWGAAMGAIWNGGRYVSHYGGGNNNITINRGNNNINTGNINRGQGAGSSTWRPSNNPAQGATARQNNRVGDAGRGGQLGDGGRGGGQIGGGAGAAQRPATSGAGRGDSAFGGIDSGAAANRASARGAESRGSSFGGSSGSRASSAGSRTSGGARAGGGARGGGRR
jgi:hypothetical protein